MVFGFRELLLAARACARIVQAAQEVVDETTLSETNCGGTCSALQSRDLCWGAPWAREFLTADETSRSRRVLHCLIEHRDCAVTWCLIARDRLPPAPVLARGLLPLSPPEETETGHGRHL